ncbi:MAG: hypothetical protein Q9208_008337 [Pyrenodesmia sp. 3 TL-2023]
MDHRNSPTLLTLPPEIRLQIYSDVLCFDGVQPKISWVEPFNNSFARWCAMERGTYVHPTPKPRPWPIEVRLDVLSHMRDPSSSDGAAWLPSHEEQLLVEHQLIAPRRDWIRLETLLQVLGTCRQIYDEARGIFWSKNRFLIGRNWALFYFQYGLGARRLRYITCVALQGCENIETWCTAEQTTELLLGDQTASPMTNVSLEYFLEYQFVRKVLDAVESRSEGFDAKLERYRQRSAERREKTLTAEDRTTALAVVDVAGQVRGSVYILGDAIKAHNEGQRQRQKQNRRFWHIEYEWLRSGENSHPLIWLTNNRRGGGNQ